MTLPEYYDGLDILKGELLDFFSDKGTGIMEMSIYRYSIHITWKDVECDTVLTKYVYGLIEQFFHKNPLVDKVCVSYLNARLNSVIHLK